MGQDEKPVASGATPVAVDGGYGWVVVAASFLAYFIADGWAYSFGVIYPVLIEQFGDSKGKTAIIGALLYGVPLLVSPLVCALTAVYGCRAIAIAGGITMGVSFVISAFATSVDFLCLSTGILASLGLSMTYIPSLFIVTYYFEKRRALAIGLAVTGSGLGAFAVPPLLEFLIHVYTWRGAMLILGGFCFNIVVAGLLFRPLPLNMDDKNTESNDNIPDRRHLRLGGGHVVLPRMHASNSAVRNRCSSLNALPTQESGAPLTTISLSAIPVNSGDLNVSSIGEEHQLLDKSNVLGVDHTISSPDLYHSALRSKENEPLRPTQESSVAKIATETCVIFRNMMDRSLASNWPFLLFCASSFITYLWIGIPLVYLVDKSLLFGIKPRDAAFLLSVIGIVRTVGQIIFGIVGDLPQVSSTLLYGIAMICCGIATALVPVFTSYGAMCFYCSVYGFAFSACYTLQMIMVVDYVGLTKATNAFGLSQLAQGVATMLGTPVAGR